jgi:aryl-alcohol dehydrogenase-like predicted oxidoreductase
MRHRLLGRSGLRVSELCLGTMTFTDGLTGWGTSRAEAAKIFDAFATAGGTFVDTADLYFGRDGVAEEILGDLLAADRDHFVLATKYTATNGDDISNSGNSLKNMRRSVEASLRRLRTDHIDLYWVHHWDSMTPTDELVRGLDQLVRSGKVLYVGLSNTPAWVTSQAVTLAEAHLAAPPIAVQVEHSLLERSAEHEIFPMAQALDLGVCAWSPLAGGLLTGKYRSTGAEPSGQRRLDDAQGKHTRPPVSAEQAAVIAEVCRIADTLGATPAQVASAWSRAQPRCIPIFGATRVEQVHDMVASLAIQLPGDDLRRLDELSAPTPGVPQAFLRAAHLRRSLSSGHWDRIDNHRALPTAGATAHVESERLFTRP